VGSCAAIVGVNAHAQRRARFAQQRLQRSCPVGADAESGNAGTSTAPARTAYRADTRFLMRDQKPRRAHVLRPAELDAAVHAGGGQWIFLTDHDDGAAAILCLPRAIL